MKAHKYWSVGALITMIGTFYTGYKGSKSSHRYFACSALICMIMSMYTGHKMIVRAGSCSPLRSFSLIRKMELWRTNKPPALRVVRIALALCKKPPMI